MECLTIFLCQLKEASVERYLRQSKLHFLHKMSKGHMDYELE